MHWAGSVQSVFGNAAVSAAHVRNFAIYDRCCLFTCYIITYFHSFKQENNFFDWISWSWSPERLFRIPVYTLRLSRISSADLPSGLQILRDLLAFIVIEEIGFYYSHRLLVSREEKRKKEKARKFEWRRGCEKEEASTRGKEQGQYLEQESKRKKNEQEQGIRKRGKAWGEKRARARALQRARERRMEKH